MIDGELKPLLNDMNVALHNPSNPMLTLQHFAWQHHTESATVLTSDHAPAFAILTQSIMLRSKRDGKTTVRNTNLRIVPIRLTLRTIAEFVNGQCFAGYTELKEWIFRSAQPCSCGVFV